MANESSISEILRNEDLYTALAAIASFLEQHQFDRTCEALKGECISRRSEPLEQDDRRETDPSEASTSCNRSIEIRSKKRPSNDQLFGPMEEYLELEKQYTDLHQKQTKLLEQLDKRRDEFGLIIPLLELQHKRLEVQRTHLSKLRPKQTGIERVAEQINDDENDAYYRSQGTKNISGMKFRFRENENRSGVTRGSAISLASTSDESITSFSVRPNTPNDQDEIEESNFMYPWMYCLNMRSVQCFNPGSNFDGRKPFIYSTPINPKKFFPQTQYFLLDYPTIKKDLMIGSLNQKVLILQALRWRLTKCPENERKFILKTYIRNDILCLTWPRTQLDVFSEDCDEKLLESLSRFINVFASLKEGRDYLCSSERVLTEILIPAIQKQMESPHRIPIFIEMLLVTLQKLSIRQKPRELMTNAGLLESITRLLCNRRNEMSVYCLEYTCALFMNLCLVESVKTRYAENPESIVSVFVCLLSGVQASSVNYIPYICVALHSVLSERSIKEEAVRQKLDLMIRQLIEVTEDKSHLKQLEFIIASRFESDDLEFTISEYPSMEELDVLDPEIDQNDVIMGEEQGETLLKTYEEELIDSENRSQGINSGSENNDDRVARPSGSKQASPKKVRKVKFDAGLSTNTCENLGINCISKSSNSSNRYDCGCLESIRRSISDEDTLFDSLPMETQQYITAAGRGMDSLDRVNADINKMIEADSENKPKDPEGDDENS